MTHGNTGPATGRETEIQRLVAELAALRDGLAAADAAAGASERLDPAYRDSARNLIHYLALRRHDIRALQERLAALGLSSLGRAESHVFGAVDAVLGVLRQLLQDGAPAAAPPAGGVRRADGDRLLREHTEALLGPARAERAVRIMVTMPAEAAQDYGLVRGLLERGMDCMRINCAHDDATAWAGMIAHLRRAEQSLQRRCRVLMDLGGPKLRTGPLSPGPQVLKVRPRRDELGRVMAPARLWLTAQEHPWPAPSAADACLQLPRDWLHGLRAGQCLRLRDAREARRELQVVETGAEGCWAHCAKTVYFVPGLELRPRHGGAAAVIGPLPAQEGALTLHAGELLLLTRGDTPGQPASHDQGGAVLTPARIGCIPAEAFQTVRAGERIWFDDGRIGGVVERADADGIAVRITQAAPGGSRLRAEKGINLPDSQLSLPAMMPKDLSDLEFVARNADLVGLSFANCAADVRQLREEIERQGPRRPGIVLKIETRRGFENLPQMLLEAMQWPRCGVMIARGDLAVECGFERMAEVQEEILWICESAHVPVIWATQVLESLARSGQPSRAEITDAAMGDRAECVMLNKGPHILEAVKVLDDILRRMQAHQLKKSPQLRALQLAHKFAAHDAPAGHRGAAAAPSGSGTAEEAAMSDKVRFAHALEVDAESRAVRFTAFWHGRMIPCGVSLDALAQHFEADAVHPDAAFERHRGAIERAAQALILSRRREADGTVLVGAADCDWLHHPPSAPRSAAPVPKAQARA